ncbi:ubiquitin-conjugating enzyme/RWD-like protein [Phycomyces nitens]|nr:ubiquitin-conjugating enzyme/RWD-like protein [Phycomyces nitens]
MTRTQRPVSALNTGGLGGSFVETEEQSFISFFTRPRTIASHPPIPSQHPNPQQNSDWDEDISDRPDLQTTSEPFRRHELMTEFTNLKNPGHCPLGMYMSPSADNINVWFGVLFVNKGLYRSGVFKFRLVIPENYPNNPPTVTFMTEVFHPLVDPKGNLNLAQRFMTWRPHQDYILHVLHYVKSIFKRAVLDGLLDKHSTNKESYQLYRKNPAVFVKLAHQCAQLSITADYLFNSFSDNNLIRFSDLSEAEFDELKAYIMKSKSDPINDDDENTIESQLRDRYNDHIAIKDNI